MLQVAHAIGDEQGGRGVGVGMCHGVSIPVALYHTDTTCDSARRQGLCADAGKTEVLENSASGHGGAV